MSVILYSDEKLIEAFNKSTSIAEITSILGVVSTQYLRKACKRLGLDYNSKKRNNRKYTDEQLVEAFNSSNSLAEVARKLGLRQEGSSLAYMQKNCDKLGLDWRSKKRQNWAKGKTFVHDERRFKYTDEQIFCKNSPYLGGSTQLKKRAKELGYLKDYCEICGQSNIWNGKELCLIIDHIDGDNKNNDPSNLRSVCPNCDIQLPTSRGKNKGKN